MEKFTALAKMAVTAVTNLTSAEAVEMNIFFNIVSPNCMVIIICNNARQLS